MRVRDPVHASPRNLVILVILTVALPSVLLVLLGFVAVSNEEVVAKERLERLYGPVLMDAAGRFNAMIDRVVEDAKPALHALAIYAEDEHHDEAIAVEAFREANPVATNFFAIGADGEVLLPRSSSGEPWTEELPAVLAAAIKDERSTESCEPYLRIVDTFSRHELTCAAHLAHTLCSIARGTTASPSSLSVMLDDRCHSTVTAREATAAIQVARDLASPARLSPSLSLLLRVLDDPLSPRSPSLVSTVAAWVATHLDGPELEADKYAFAAIADRPRLLRHLSRSTHACDAPLTSSAVRAGPWRRVLVSGAFSDVLVGFELVPATVTRAIQGDPAATPTPGVKPFLVAFESPEWVGPNEYHENKELKARVASWALLKKTDLAWQMVMLLDDTAPLFDLARSRTRLYVFALALLGLSLAIGIGYTVYATIEAARISRLKTDFVSSVSHDLRTPLTSIRMFVDTLLLDRVSSKEEAREFLEIIASETERLSRLTERILDFSRMEAGRKAYQFAPTTLGEVVERGLKACQPLIQEAGFEVHVSGVGGLPGLEADRDALIEAFINVLTNAIKYSPEHRTVRIVGRAAPGGVELSVEDRGIGIPRAEQGKIFEKFYRVDCRRGSEVGGSGIGLSLVKHIVEAHGGRVQVDSAPDRGSTFTLFFPVAAEPGVSLALDRASAT